MPTVLIVDDSNTEIHAFTSMLTKHDFEVITAKNGEQGVAMAEQEKPDLILMDIVMPEMDGFQATRKLKANPLTETIPVIIISTKDQDTDKIWALRQGATEYLIKPVAADKLIETINRLL